MAFTPVVDGDAATPAFMNARFSELLGTEAINVKASAYGAVGDGTTDDRAAIQAALDAADAAGGGVVFLPPGTYILGTNTHRYDSARTVCLEVPTKVTLMGAGPEATILKLKSDATNQTRMIENKRLDNPNDKNITLRDFTLDGNNTAFAVASGYDRINGIMMHRVTNLKVENVKIKNLFGSASGGNGPNGTEGEAFAIGPSNVSGLVVHNVEVESGAASVGASGTSSVRCQSLRFSNVRIRDAWQAAFAINHCEDVMYSNCHASHSSGAGFNTEDSRNISFNGCIASDGSNSFGFAIDDTYGVSFNGCIARENASHGFALLGTNTSDWMDSNGSYIVGAGGFLVGAQDVTFAGGVALDNGGFGVSHATGRLRGTLPFANKNSSGSYSINTAQHVAIMKDTGLQATSENSLNPGVVLSRLNSATEWRLHCDDNALNFHNAAIATPRVQIFANDPLVISVNTLRLGEAGAGGGLAGNAAGTPGDIAWGSSSNVSYLYVCVSANSWHRAALSPF